MNQSMPSTSIGNTADNEQEKRELILANKEQVLQNVEKEKLADELFKANQELKRTERYQSELLEKFNKSQSIAKIGSLELDIISGVVWWSDELYRIFDVDKDNYTPSVDSNAKFVHPDDSEAFHKEVFMSFETGEHVDYTIRIITNSGQLKHCQFVSNIIYNDNKEPIKMIGSFTDITERKQAEILLRDEKDRIRTILDMIGDPIFVKDNDHRITLANRAFYDIFNMDENSVIGYTLVEAVPENERHLFLKVDRSVLDTGITDIREEELTVGDITRTIVTRKSRYNDESGNRFLVGSIHDITDRIKAEVKLKESEDRFRYIFENSTVGKSLTTIDGKLTTNKTFSDIVGYSQDELQRLNWTDITYPDDIEQDKKIIKSIVDNERQKDRWVKRYIHKNGSIIWVDVSTSLKRDTNNKPEYFMTSVINITKQINLQEQLRETNEYLENLFNYANAPIIVWDNSLNITRFNHAFEELTGYSANEVIGKNMNILFPIEYLENSIELINISMSRKKWESEEIIIKGKDGEYHDILWNSANIFDKEGIKIIASIAQGFDITDRKKAENDLRDSEERFRKAVEEAPVPMLIHDEDDNNIFLSKGWTKHSGYTIDDIPTISDWSEKAYGERSSFVKEYIDNLFEINETIGNGEWEIKTKQGNSRIWEFFTTPIGHSRTGKRLLLSVAIDVTERKQAEEELTNLNAELEFKVNERTEQLETANKELESFSYSVSHDLRAPLRGIDGFSKILLEDYSDVLDDEGHRLLNVIVTNIQKMTQLIDDLLNFSRISRHEVVKYKINIKNLINTCYQELTSQEQREKIEFNIEDIPDAFGDPSLIKQLIANLLSNALKFSSKTATPSINIGFKLDNQKVIYFMRDNGIGFDMKYYNKLFGVFQRLHSNTEFEGTGVGLAIAQRIIYKHEGEIWAESELNKGATFYFSI